MRIRARIIGLWRTLFRKQELENDLSDELGAYLEEQIQRRIRAGETPDIARRNALIEFGGFEQIKDACREVRRAGFLDCLLQDLRHARGLFADNEV